MIVFIFCMIVTGLYLDGKPLSDLRETFKGRCLLYSGQNWSCRFVFEVKCPLDSPIPPKCYDFCLLDAKFETFFLFQNFN